MICTDSKPLIPQSISYCRATENGWMVDQTWHGHHKATRQRIPMINWLKQCKTPLLSHGQAIGTSDQKELEIEILGKTGCWLGGGFELWTGKKKTKILNLLWEAVHEEVSFFYEVDERNFHGPVGPTLTEVICGDHRRCLLYASRHFI